MWSRSWLAILATASVLDCSSADALTLTQAGIDNGFTLNLFMSGIPATSGTPSSGCCGPLGIATNSSGQVVMQVYGLGNYLFNDGNGQVFNPAAQTSTLTATSYGMAITNSGGVLYAGNNDSSGTLQKLNSNGSFNSTVATTPSAFVAGHGIATNPVNGHIITSSFNGLWDINPVTGQARQIFASGAAVDGVSVSADGKIVYGALDGAANGNIIRGWDIATGQTVFNSQVLNDPDGTGVIGGSGQFAGDIVANGNHGEVWLINHVTGVATLIASGGTRGDYVGVDGNDGTLFLTQTNEVYKLGCGPDCGFVGTPAVPEASTWAMMLIGFAGVGCMGFHRRRRLHCA